MYAVMLGLLDGEDVMDRAFLYNAANRGGAIGVSSKSLNMQMGKTNAQSEEKQNFINEILSNEKQSKMLSKAGFITGNFLATKPYSLPEVGKDILKAQNLSTCNKFTNKLDDPGCLCNKINHNTICGNQCVPVNKEHKDYTTFYNSMCVQDAQIIELEDGEELIMVDGFFPTDFIRPKDPKVIKLLLFIVLLLSFSCSEKAPRDVEPTHVRPFKNKNN